MNVFNSMVNWTIHLIVDFGSSQIPAPRWGDGEAGDRRGVRHRVLLHHRRVPLPSTELQRVLGHRQPWGEGQWAGFHLKSQDLLVFGNRKYLNPVCWPEISFFRTTPSTWQTVDQNRRSSCRSAPTTESGGSGRAPRSSTMWSRSPTRETPSPGGSVVEWPGTPHLLLCIPFSLQGCFITKGKEVGEMCHIWNSCNIFLKIFICLQTCIENIIIDKESYK